MIRANLQKDKLIRLLELFLLITIAFGNSILYSFFSLINPDKVYRTVWQNIDLVSIILSEIVAIILLLYFLDRQKRNIKDIGLKLNFKSDVFEAVLITISLCIFSPLLYNIGYIVYSAMVAKPDINHFTLDVKQASIILGLIFMIINLFCEELIIRAYLMTEVEYFTNSKTLAFIISLIIQTSYHFYQGLASTLYLVILFFVWSFYYAKYKKIMPVILSHLYFDLFALFSDWLN